MREVSCFRECCCPVSTQASLGAVSQREGKMGLPLTITLGRHWSNLELWREQRGDRAMHVQTECFTPAGPGDFAGKRNQLAKFRAVS